MSNYFIKNVKFKWIYLILFVFCLIPIFYITVWTVWMVACSRNYTGPSLWSTINWNCTYTWANGPSGMMFWLTIMSLFAMAVPIFLYIYWLVWMIISAISFAKYADSKIIKIIYIILTTIFIICLSLYIYYLARFLWFIKW